MTAEVKSQYDRDGYVLLRGFMSAAEIGETLDVLARFIRDQVPTLPREHVFYEDKSQPDTLKQLQSLFRYEPYFDTLMFRSKFTKLAEFLLGTPAIGKNMQYFNKPPLIGQPTPPHQDGYYFMLQPCEALTMWLALENVDEENGCVRYVRGSHRHGMRPHGRTHVLGFSQGITDFGTADDVANEIAFPAQPGDLLAHHALTIHRADGNRSATRTRRALGFIYYSDRAKEDVAAHAAYQRKLAEELKRAQKI